MKNNETIPFTRRYPDLKNKVAKRDSIIAQKLINAWDIERDGDKVLSIFLKEHKNLSDFRYWELLKVAWICCGSTNRLDLFAPLFKSQRKHKHYFMTPEEHARFRNLPEMFNVFCACNEEPGFSWTIDENYALKFKEMFNKQQIISKTVFKAETFALIERNLEEEILIIK